MEIKHQPNQWHLSKAKKQKLGRDSFILGNDPVKFIDNGFSATTLSATPLILVFNLTAEGTGENFRTGWRTRNLSLTGYWEITTSAPSPAYGITVRFALIYVKRVGGVPPVPASNLAAPAGAGAVWLQNAVFGAGDHTLDLRHPASKDNIVVLREWREHVGPFFLTAAVPATGAGDTEKMGQFHVPLNGLLSKYTGIGANIANLAEGGIMMAVCADNDNATFDLNTRLCFDDD